MISLQIFVHKQ